MFQQLPLRRLEWPTPQSLERPLFRGWFQISDVIETMVKLELKKPLQHLIQQYDWRGEVIVEATKHGLQSVAAQVLKRPCPEYLPDVKIRSHMTQQVGNQWYWYPTLDCDDKWFDQLGQAHSEIIRRNDIQREIAFAIRDLLRECRTDLSGAPRDRVKAVILMVTNKEDAA